jgi:hypothetical protein
MPFCQSVQIGRALVFRRYDPNLGKSRPDNKIQAVMLYAFKSKKVERKFAHFGRLPTI